MVTEIILPHSKSMTNRALIISALLKSETSIYNPSTCEDSYVMINALKSFGIKVLTYDNRLVVTHPSEYNKVRLINICLSGTVMRFIPMLSLFYEGETVLFSRYTRMMKRPIMPLLKMLKKNNLNIKFNQQSQFYKLIINKTNVMRLNKFVIDTTLSSQFLSAILLVSPFINKYVNIVRVGKLPSLGYIKLTIDMLKPYADIEYNSDYTEFNIIKKPSNNHVNYFNIEPDIASAVVFMSIPIFCNKEIIIKNWVTKSLQPPYYFLQLLLKFNLEYKCYNNALYIKSTIHPNLYNGLNINLEPYSELLSIIVVILLHARSTSYVYGVDHVKGHESDRINALCESINSIGGYVEYKDRVLIIKPVYKYSGIFNTYGDHRLIMAGMLLTLKHDIKLDRVDGIEKTFPAFFKEWNKIICK